MASTMPSSSTTATTSTTFRRSNLSRSPFTMNLNELLSSMLPQVQDKSIKYAFYNTIGMISVAVMLLVLIAVHFILEPFLRPLLWALLFGSALHPFKSRLMSVSQNWLASAKRDETPLAIASLLLPFSIINYLLDVFSHLLVQYAKLLLFTLISLPISYLFFKYLSFTSIIYSFLVSTYDTLINLLLYLTTITNSYVIFTLVVAHLFFVSVCWSEVTKPFLTLISPVIWFALCIHCVALSGTFGVFLSFGVISVIMVGMILRVIRGNKEEDKDSGDDQVDGMTLISNNLVSLFWFLWSYISCLLPSHWNDNEENDSMNDSNDNDVSTFLDEDEEQEGHNNSVILEGQSPMIKSLSSSDKQETPGSKQDSQSHLPNDELDSPVKKPVTNINVATSPFSPQEFRQGVSFPKQRRQSLLYSSSRNSVKQASKSNKYLYALLWAFLLTQLWFHPRFLYFAPILIFVTLIKWCFTQVSNSLFFIDKLDQFKNLLNERSEALVHPMIKEAFQYFKSGDRMLLNVIEASLNTLTSLSVIFLMLICVLFATVFIAMQIYGESLHLVNVMSNVVNSTLQSNSELAQLLPEGLKGMQHVMDDVISNAYHYGRCYIKNTIRIALNVDENDNKTKVVEKQVLEVWDRAYHLWLVRNTNESDFIYRSGPYNWNKLINATKTLDFALCFKILKENIDIVMSVFESVWHVLKGNISLLFGAITAVISLLFGGGSALLNFCLSLVVFTTALFYLLSSSGETYKPVELINRLIPRPTDSSESTNHHHESPSLSTASKFSRAVEEAVNGVFAASLKMIVFYGMYTWLIHTLFEVNIIYIPSVIAAILSAVPFLGAYWASLPAVLELWFVHGETGKALLMSVTAMLPTYFVDSIIYREIKGAGHPYLTGLAIAGGAFYLGFEGAFFGPMLLCCLFVAFNMYGTIIQDNTDSKDEFSSKIKVRPQLKRIQSTLH